MSRRMRAVILSAAVVAGLPCAAAAAGPEPNQAPASSPQTERRPDVIFVPTRELVIDAMLKAAKVGPNDVVYDLGCGDGRIVVAAAKLGARAVGIDIDPQRIKEANENAAKNGVTGKVDFRQARPVRGRHPRSHRGDALPAAQPERQTEAPPDGSAEARYPHRVARLRHGRLGTRSRRSRWTARRSISGPSRRSDRARASSPHWTSRR